VIDWHHVRADFPALENHTYLNTAGIGLTPQPVTAEIQHLFGAWCAHGATTPTFRQEVSLLEATARDRAGRLFGASHDELAFTGRVAESLHIVLDGLAWRPGDRIITSDEEVLYAPLYRLVKYHGVRIIKMRLPHNRDEILSRLADLLRPRTRLLWLSHTTNKTGITLPAAEITALAHARGALVMFDGAQSAGQFPIDLHAIGCDFYAITGYKWLLGPYGCGLLYVRQDLIPTLSAFRLGQATLDHAHDSYEEPSSAVRYEFGVRNVILRIGFGEALHYLALLGPKAVQERLAQLSDYLRRGLEVIPGCCIASPRDPTLNSAITCLVLEGLAPEHVVAEAWRANVVIVPTEVPPTRPDLHGVRISPGFYNSEQDIDRLLQVIDVLKH
jgi:selenocysteine lyase/cysteine desulfurase